MKIYIYSFVVNLSKQVCIYLNETLCLKLKKNNWKNGKSKLISRRKADSTMAKIQKRRKDIQQSSKHCITKLVLCQNIVSEFWLYTILQQLHLQIGFESHMHTYKIIYLSKLIVLPFTTFVNNMSVYTQPVGHLGVYIYFSYGI